MIEFNIYGDSAVLINFEQKIDKSVNDEVIMLTQAIENATVPGVLNCIPAYCSITVIYDPEQIKYDLLIGLIKTISQQKKDNHKQKKQRKLLIPVCYSPPYEMDMKELELLLGISQKEIVEQHTQTDFQVYMLGFLPGFAYMGSLPRQLICSRKKSPRLKVPAQSVGLAGQQTGIYPIEAPGGWQIIGRTPVPVFAPKNENPFLFKPGDLVQFYPISNVNFEKIEKDVLNEQFNFQNIYAQS